MEQMSFISELEQLKEKATKGEWIVNRGMCGNNCAAAIKEMKLP